MEKFLPDKYYKNIYEINYQKLRDEGITCLLFDLDNTLVPPHMTKPDKKIKDLFDNLKELDFRVIIMSNSGKKRLTPFKDELITDCSAKSLKPLKKKFLKILKEYNLDVSETAIIGDQLLTDVLGGNRVGITTILVNPISKKDIIFTKLNRKIERFIERKFLKKGFFKRGNYYD